MNGACNLDKFTCFDLTIRMAPNGRPTVHKSQIQETQSSVFSMSVPLQIFPFPQHAIKGLRLFKFEFDPKDKTSLKTVEEFHCSSNINGIYFDDWWLPLITWLIFHWFSLSLPALPSLHLGCDPVPPWEQRRRSLVLWPPLSMTKWLSTGKSSGATRPEIWGNWWSTGTPWGAPYLGQTQWTDIFVYRVYIYYFIVYAYSVKCGNML